VQRVDLILLMRDGAVEMFGPRTEILKRVVTQPTADNRPTAESCVAKVAAPARRFEQNRAAS
jgi:ABC-type protease/lipase transport system fused ATPase/permease subunit